MQAEPGFPRFFHTADGGPPFRREPGPAPTLPPGFNDKDGFMTAQRSDVPGAVPEPEADAAGHGDVVRRATLLCLRAEPHAEQSPCATHLSEANRQLFGIAV
jgi:hypothetical protein